MTCDCAGVNGVQARSGAGPRRDGDNCTHHSVLTAGEERDWVLGRGTGESGGEVGGGRGEVEISLLYESLRNLVSLPLSPLAGDYTPESGVVTIFQTAGS